MEGFLPTAVICLVLLMIVVFSVRSYLKKLKSGCFGAGGDEVKRIRPADRDASHYSYARLVRIEGMHCQNCARRVENAFNSQEGFYAKVDLAKKDGPGAQQGSGKRPAAEAGGAGAGIQPCGGGARLRPLFVGRRGERGRFSSRLKLLRNIAIVLRRSKPFSFPGEPVGYGWTSQPDSRGLWG